MPSLTSCPIGVLPECDFIARFPERKPDLIVHALHQRERQLFLLKQARRQLVFHPLNSLKVIFVSGILSFFVSFFLSQFSALGAWYVAARQTSVDLPLVSHPWDIGSYLPISAPLNLAAKLPTISFSQSIVFGLGIMLAIFLERTISAFIMRHQVTFIHHSESELLQEIDTLRAWAKAGESMDKTPIS